MSKGINQELEEDQEEKESTKNNLDKGLLVAIIAILISIATAFISLYEAKLMKAQQAIMMEQSSASAWPYIQIRTHSVVELNSVKLKLTIENKGVGPAIMKDVRHSIQGFEVETYNYLSKLEELYPDFEYTLISNQQIDNIVISAKEVIVFLEFIVKLNKGNNEDINELLNSLNKEIEFCYCSIFSECWQYEHNKGGEFERCKE